MDNAKTILKRMSDVTKAGTNKELAEKLEVSYNTLNTWVKRDNVPMDIINSFVNSEQLTYDWLLSGKGSMYLKEDSIAKSNNTVGDNSIVVNGNGSINISIKKEDFKDDSEDIKLLVSLLKYAPKSFIVQIIERLQKFKELSQL